MLAYTCHPEDIHNLYVCILQVVHNVVHVPNRCNNYAITDKSSCLPQFGVFTTVYIVSSKSPVNGAYEMPTSMCSNLRVFKNLFPAWSVSCTCVACFAMYSYTSYAICYAFVGFCFGTT